jgi:hypothetical protein
MPKGRAGLPRPLLNEMCVLAIEDFASGLSAGTYLTRAASEHMALMKVITEQVADFPVTNIAILEDDRVTAKQWGEFITEYEDELPDADIDGVSLTTHMMVDSNITRPLAEVSGTEADMRVEVNFSKAYDSMDEIDRLSEVLLKEVDEIYDYTRFTDLSTIFILSADGMPVENIANMINEINGRGVPLRDIVFTCSIREI